MGLSLRIVTVFWLLAGGFSSSLAATAKDRGWFRFEGDPIEKPFWIETLAGESYLLARKSEGAWTSRFVKETLSRGQKIRTTANGFSRIYHHSGLQLLLFPGTDVLLGKPEAPAGILREGSDPLELQLDQGRVRVTTAKEGARLLLRDLVLEIPPFFDLWVEELKGRISVHALESEFSEDPVRFLWSPWSQAHFLTPGEVFETLRLPATKWRQGKFDEEKLKKSLFSELYFAETLWERATTGAYGTRDDKAAQKKRIEFLKQTWGPDRPRNFQSTVGIPGN
jgi:hypothetical protein